MKSTKRKSLILAALIALGLGTAFIAVTVSNTAISAGSQTN
jgi:hypothetical protein